jgi:hypothetical protein
MARAARSHSVAEDRIAPLFGPQAPAHGPCRVLVPGEPGDAAVTITLNPAATAYPAVAPDVRSALYAHWIAQRQRRGGALLPVRPLADSLFPPPPAEDRPKPRSSPAAAAAAAPLLVFGDDDFRDSTVATPKRRGRPPGRGRHTPLSPGTPVTPVSSTGRPRGRPRKNGVLLPSALIGRKVRS